jgi:TatD DNase family protein
MFGKPVVIHTRDADDDTIRLLEQHAGGMKVIIHCFSMASRIDECLAHEHWWISFAGNVTYPKNQDLRDAALRVPADRMLVETDAPYLSPQAQRGKPNSPALVAQTAQALALERRVSYHDFNVEVESAAQAVFGW